MMVRESKCKSDDFAIFYVYPIQLLEYQTDVWRCWFDTLGKLTPAHRAGAPTTRERWVCSRTVGESDCLHSTVAGPPTVREQFKVLPHGGWTCYSGERTICVPTAHEWWVLLHGWQGLISPQV